MSKICCSKVAKQEGEMARQTGNYLPIQAKLFNQGWHKEIMREIIILQVGDTRFPLPDNSLLAGKRVKSVVLVLPDNYKLWTIIFNLKYLLKALRSLQTASIEWNNLEFFSRYYLTISGISAGWLLSLQICTSTPQPPHPPNYFETFYF